MAVKKPEKPIKEIPLVSHKDCLFSGDWHNGISYCTEHHIKMPITDEKLQCIYSKLKL
jgi:hypothetical protein